jgi:hypothetical protein
MFARFFRSSSNNDLEEYRRGYPGKTDNNDPRKNANLLFYRNERPMMPDQILIDVFHERCFGRYQALESGHSFIQWLFPIQEESPFNAHSQELQKHEIIAMRKEGPILHRIFKSLELMLDFYGFDIAIEMPNKNKNKNQEKKKKQQQKNKNNEEDDDDDDDNEVAEDEEQEEEKDDDEEDPYANFDWVNLKDARCLVRRQTDQRASKAKFNNLLNHSHNNLRITRILKCLGEMGLENLKLGVLSGFRREIFETGALGDLAASYVNYWSGTIYNDEIRQQFQSVANDFQARGTKKK